MLRARGKILNAIRTWFQEHGYVEVHTPLLVKSPAMEEHLHAIPVENQWLHTSPEFAMKRVLSSGLCRIYQIAPCFRKEEVGVHHSKEFTMLEWYRVGAGTEELMDDVESLIACAAQSIGTAIPQWERIPVSSLINESLAPEDWFFEWVDQVEPTLNKPTIVYGYPVWQSALAKIRGGLADRFEVYLEGLELGNAFAEETNATELRGRWENNNQKRSAAGYPKHTIDNDFLNAVDKMPRCAGIAMGIDRLVMALTKTDHIKHVQV